MSDGKTASAIFIEAMCKSASNLPEDSRKNLVDGVSKVVNDFAARPIELRGLSEPELALLRAFERDLASRCRVPLQSPESYN